jgi:hypothetical protein
VHSTVSPSDIHIDKPTKNWIEIDDFIILRDKELMLWQEL